MTTWLKDDNGNKCSVEYFGSEEAAQKALDSLEDCKNCTNCSGCYRCSDCYRCNHDMSQAPRDGTLILAYAPAAHGLDEIVRVCGWHPDAGFCICELREVTAWCHLMPPPRETK